MLQTDVSRDRAEPAIRDATAADIEALQALILMHGPNRWNHLPADAIRAHLDDLADGATGAVVACEGAELVAAVTFEISDAFARYLPPAQRHVPQGHVCEAVVRRDRAGRGLGARLLRAALARLRQRGHAVIYIERHEQNAASAGMMRKAGFEVLETYDDPLRRPHGSRRTTVCRWVAADAAAGAVP